MKTFISALLAITALSCSSDRKPEEVERQEEVIQREEESRTGKSEEMGPGFEYGTTSSPN